MTPARARAGFTLSELLIALVIVAVLMSVALPAYREQVLAARRVLAKLELLGLQARQEQLYLERQRYARDLLELGMPGSPYALDGDGNALPASAPRRLYRITLEAGDTAYRLVATPVSSQAVDRRCGVLALASDGTRSSTGVATTEECW